MKAGDQMKRTVGFLGLNIVEDVKNYLSIQLNKIQNKGLVVFVYFNAEMVHVLSLR